MKLPSLSYSIMSKQFALTKTSRVCYLSTFLISKTYHRSITGTHEEATQSASLQEQRLTYFPRNTSMVPPWHRPSKQSWFRHHLLGHS